MTGTAASDLAAKDLAATESSRRVIAEGTLTVPLPPRQAMDLFTPLGEKQWVEGWHPVMVYPRDGQLEEGQVFVTDHGGEETIWSVLRADREQHELEYMRVTPGSRLGRVSVALRDLADGSSKVWVRYTLTALVPESEAQIQDFAANYPSMMAEWQELLEQHLEQR